MQLTAGQAIPALPEHVQYLQSSCRPDPATVDWTHKCPRVFARGKRLDQNQHGVQAMHIPVAGLSPIVPTLPDYWR